MCDRHNLSKTRKTVDMNHLRAIALVSQESSWISLLFQKNHQGDRPFFAGAIAQGESYQLA
ncbi:MAG: hypothetical protein HC941_26165 [Microcoleus sp. SU_5_3]|nr:hypothetical protein [Microcoleus sp. SU_5_3]